MRIRWFLPLLTLPLAAADSNGIEIIERTCTACHGASKMSGLDLRERDTALKGGSRGPAFKPGNSAESLIIQVITGEKQPKMPPGKDSLSKEEIATLREWIDRGASWASVGKGGKSNWWSFQQTSKPDVPKVKNTAWVKNPIDAFILRKLEDNNLKPAVPASKLVLLRRVTFDLTGLPPTETEIREYLADNSPDAYTKLIDRLLNSPRYGEKWGRHWLDVARYADSTGLDEDHRYPHAWRYRDWVIKAFNQDLPFDQFARMQIAGDLLPSNPTDALNKDGIVATGFLALGPKPIAQQDKKQMVYDVIDEQIDVTTKAFLGVTMSCARCHDHKFDPFPTKDYYSLASIFASTKTFKKVGNGGVSEMYAEPLCDKQTLAEYEAYKKKIGDVKKSLEDIKQSESARYASTMQAQLVSYMTSAWRVYEKHEEATQVAAKANLDAGILEKWVAYLKPTPEDKPQLEAWWKVSESNLQQVAQEYQKRFDKAAAEWEEEMAGWRAKVESRRKNNMELPEPPRIRIIKEKFFRDVSFGSGPFALPEKDAEKKYTPESYQQFKKLKDQIAQLEKNPLPEPDMANSVAEGEPFDQKVHVRGSYGNLGDPVSKRFPIVLAGAQQADVRTVSGRLELANWLGSKENPLTARVMANRVWQWHFNEGIVRTPNNFGKLGSKPTHPELLDWLATYFMENGWSVKKLHRLMLTSNSYQMGSEITAEAAKGDTGNQFFSRFPRRRLDIEEIRDSYLALDESIDWKSGGTLQSGVGTDGENSAKRLSLNPESFQVRTVYLPLRRSNLPNLFNLFDFVDSTTSCEMRSRTNVAPQALFVMNSQFVADRAKGIAKILMSQESDDRARLKRAYLRILNRQPESSEISEALDYISTFSKRNASDSNLKGWESYMRILMASNEYVYVD